MLPGMWQGSTAEGAFPDGDGIQGIAGAQRICMEACLEAVEGDWRDKVNGKL